VDPTTVLARIGAELRVHRDPLALPGRIVFGTWDPLLRRIDLYACDESRSDLDIIQSLGHEIFHVLDDSAGHDGSETAAEQFAEAWTAQLGPAGVAAWARSLRQLAVGPDNTGNPTTTRATGPAK
jgi:hypothetical protein